MRTIRLEFSTFVRIILLEYLLGKDSFGIRSLSLVRIQFAQTERILPIGIRYARMYHECRRERFQM